MRIAFFTLNAYDMLTGGHEGHAVGGAQLQQILIGREFSRRGHQIYFVEYDAEFKREQTIDGIEVVTKPRPTGSEVSRAFTVVQGTRDVLDRIDPDVCYRRSLDFEILPLSLFASLMETRFVYGIAHDDELTDDTAFFSGGIKGTVAYKRVNRYAISNADTVIAQNAKQYDAAEARFRAAVTRIPNCYSLAEVEPIEWDYPAPVVFWAGRIRSVKRPLLVAELAEKLPEITFVMAGGPGDESLYTELKTTAESLDNLTLLGHIPFEEIDHYFSAADLFLNTSEAEGFPNTFLQAWAQSTPVASLVADPDDILSNEGIGFCANGSVDELQEWIFSMVHDDKKRDRYGHASRTYLQNNHTIEAIGDRYERAFSAD